MDDHEVDNNWAANVPQDPWAQTLLEFKVRKLAAFKAWYEHMPVERPPQIDGIEASLEMTGIYRFGAAQVHLLDTRQFRDDQVCGNDFPGQMPCNSHADPKRSVLGAAQEQWLAQSLRASQARYNVLASQMWLSPYRFNNAPADPAVNMDAWDGYPAARQRMIELLGDGISNPVALSGDWHCAAAMTLHASPFDAKSKPVAHEFAGTSISSDCGWMHEMDTMRSANPHVHHLNTRQRGYCRFEVSDKSWLTTYRVVENAYDAGSRVKTDAEMKLQDL